MTVKVQVAPVTWKALPAHWTGADGRGTTFVICTFSKYSKRDGAVGAAVQAARWARNLSTTCA